MNFDNFTIKSQEVVQQAVQTAQQNGNQAIEPEHLLKALLDKGESVVKFVFQKGFTSSGLASPFSRSSA